MGKLVCIGTKKLSTECNKCKKKKKFEKKGVLVPQCFYYSFPILF